MSQWECRSLLRNLGRDRRSNFPASAATSGRDDVNRTCQFRGKGWPTWERQDVTLHDFSLDSRGLTRTSVTGLGCDGLSWWLIFGASGKTTRGRPGAGWGDFVRRRRSSKTIFAVLDSCLNGRPYDTPSTGMVPRNRIPASRKRPPTKRSVGGTVSNKRWDQPQLIISVPGWQVTPERHARSRRHRTTCLDRPTCANLCNRPFEKTPTQKTGKKGDLRDIELLETARFRRSNIMRTTS